MRFLPASTLHNDPYNENDTSMNYIPSQLVNSKVEPKRNMEPELRFYPAEGQVKKQPV